MPALLVHSRLIGLAVALLALAMAPVRAQPGVEDFYKKTPLTMTIGYSTGGGFDTHARTVARYISKYIPGHPTIILQNMPGAGSLVATNYIYNVAPKDGSVFALARAPVLEPLTGTATSNFDATKLTWIGSGMTEFTVCAFLGNPRIQTFADITRVPSTMASSGPGSDDDMISKVLIKLFDLKARIVTGYPGGAEMLLAVDRGEVDGRCGWSFTSIKQARPEWITEHKLRFMASVSLERWPELPDVPAIMEFATTERQRQILSFVISIGALGRPFIAPPGIPPERAAALRTAFAKAIQDPDYVAETIARKETPLLVDGAGAERIIKELFLMPKDVTAETKAMIASNAGAQ